MSPDQLPQDENQLRQKLESDPSDWETRRRLAHVLYDRDAFGEAAEVVWMADQIPSNDIDLAFAARILSKSQPRKAIRLLAAILELNRGKAVQNMGMANALLHHGMVLQAARFYGAALEADPTLVNPDLEHFILWTDDEMRLWADFTNRRPKLGELPWMARDPMEALRLTSRVSLHTTPISVPSLPAVPGEELRQDLYQQVEEKNGKITPPPAVTIPIDRVDPKHRRYDDHYGATVVGSDPAPAPAAAPTTGKPKLIPAAKAPVKAPAATAAPVPAPAAPPAPTPVAVPPLQVPVPMAIPLPEHVVPVAPPIASVAPTVPISPPAPSRSPSALPAPGATIPLGKSGPPAPAPGATIPLGKSGGPSLSAPGSTVPLGKQPMPTPAPTRKLLTPGGKPAIATKPGAASPPNPPQDGK